MSRLPKPFLPHDMPRFLELVDLPALPVNYRIVPTQYGGWAVRVEALHFGVHIFPLIWEPVSSTYRLLGSVVSFSDPDDINARLASHCPYCGGVNERYVEGLAVVSSLLYTIHELECQDRSPYIDHWPTLDEIPEGLNPEIRTNDSLFLLTRNGDPTSRQLIWRTVMQPIYRWFGPGYVVDLSSCLPADDGD